MNNQFSITKPFFPKQVLRIPTSQGGLHGYSLSVDHKSLFVHYRYPRNVSFANIQRNRHRLPCHAYKFARRVETVLQIPKSRHRFVNLSYADNPMTVLSSPRLTEIRAAGFSWFSKPFRSFRFSHPKVRKMEVALLNRSQSEERDMRRVLKFISRLDPKARVRLILGSGLCESGKLPFFSYPAVHSMNISNQVKLLRLLPKGQELQHLFPNVGRMQFTWVPLSPSQGLQFRAWLSLIPLHTLRIDFSSPNNPGDLQPFLSLSIPSLRSLSLFFNSSHCINGKAISLLLSCHTWIEILHFVCNKGDNNDALVLQLLSGCLAGTTLREFSWSWEDLDFGVFAKFFANVPLESLKEISLKNMRFSSQHICEAREMFRSFSRSSLISFTIALCVDSLDCAFLSLITLLEDCSELKKLDWFIHFLSSACEGLFCCCKPNLIAHCSPSFPPFPFFSQLRSLFISYTTKTRDARWTQFSSETIRQLGELVHIPSIEVFSQRFVCASEMNQRKLIPFFSYSLQKN